MKGLTTEIISVEMDVDYNVVQMVVDELSDNFEDAEITTDNNVIFMHWKLENIEYTYYPQTYYEPSEWDCDEWIYEEDLKEQILNIAHELNVEIEITKLSCEEEEDDYE